MNADQVVKKIRDDARAKADAIRGEAEQRVDRECQRFEREKAAYVEETGQLAEAKAAEEEGHRTARARMEAARRVLSEKQQILEETFQAAREKVLEMPEEVYRDWIRDLLLAAVETGEEEVILDRREGRVDAAFLKGLKGESGKAWKLRLSDKRRDLGGAGFVLVNGKVRTNASLTLLLEQARAVLEHEIASLLFNNDNDKDD